MALATSAPSQPASRIRSRSRRASTPPPARRRSSGNRFRSSSISPRSAPQPVPTRARSSTSSARHAGLHGLRREAQRVGLRAHGVLHRRVEDGAAQAEIDAEDHLLLAHEPDDLGEIGERAQRLEADDHLARAAGHDLERAFRRVRAGVHHDGAGEPGLELGQLAEHRALDRPALDRVEVRDVAGGGAEARPERAEQRHRIADRARHQGGLDGLVARPIARLRPDGDAAREIEHRYDVHGSKLPATEAR